MITVRDLLAEPSLQLRLVAGASGLGRHVTAAHVSELLRPGDWMHGGEVLMTLGLLMDDDSAQARAYVEHCAGAGLAAVVVGLGQGLPLQAAPPVLVAAAEDLGMPLLELPAPVPFVALTKWVFATIAQEEREELRRMAVASRALTASAVTSDPVPAVLSTWFRETGTACAVLDLGGTVLAAGGTLAGEVLARGAVLAERMSREGLMTSSWPRGEAQLGLDAHPLGTGRPRGVLLLARASDGAAPMLVSVLVSLLSLHLDHRFVEGRPERAHRSHVVAQLLRSGLPADAGARLAARVGLGGGPCRVVVVMPHRTDDLEDLAAQLSAALPGSSARPRPSGVELVIPHYVEGVAGLLDRAVEGRPAGVGPLVPLDQLAGSARKAYALLAMSREVGRPVESDETSSTVLLQDLGRPEVLAAYSAVVLERWTSCRRSSGSSSWRPWSSGSRPTEPGRQQLSASTCTATPCATASRRSPNSPAVSWDSARSGTPCGWRCAHGAWPATPGTGRPVRPLWAEGAHLPRTTTASGIRPVSTRLTASAGTTAYSCRVRVDRKAV